MVVGLTTEQVIGLVSQKAELQGLEERRPVSQHHLQEHDPSERLSQEALPPGTFVSSINYVSSECDFISLMVFLI